ncbi:MAG: hypothetical protein QNK19_01015 [Xanthomonadales bacterium]|nr:hypothetical protein [Xanthomonadales bacterium]
MPFLARLSLIVSTVGEDWSQPERDIPGVPEKVLDAATVAVPLRQSVLPRTAKTQTCSARETGDLHVAFFIVYDSFHWPVVFANKSESCAGIRSRRAMTGKAVITTIELYPSTTGAAITVNVYALET